MRRSAITRVEVLVLLVLGVLVTGVLVMLLARQRENGLRLQCTNHLRRLGEGLTAYADARKPNSWLPPARIAPGFATWAVLIAPYLVDDSHPLTRWDVSRSYFTQPPQVREAL